MGKSKEINPFELISDPETLFRAWYEFRKGKGNKPDVLEFEADLEPNVFRLSRELRSGKYRHSGYSDFYVLDPKRRHVHKASVPDRVLHHAVVRALEPVFDPSFIDDSFSCRKGKWVHAGVDKLRSMLMKSSRNGTRPCYALKCDIAKFFDSVDHDILLSALGRRVKNTDLSELLRNIVESFVTPGTENDFFQKGIPIGNLTSQLFANVYMNEFDQFAKHVLKAHHYVRYTDDFVIVSEDPEFLHVALPKIEAFLCETLRLKLHPEKVSIRKFRQGIDFLGHVIFPNHTLVRKRTRKRILRKWKDRLAEFENGSASRSELNATLQSFLGVLSHADSYRFSERLRNERGLYGYSYA